MPESLVATAIGAGPIPNHVTFCVDSRGKGASAGDAGGKAQVILLLINDCTRLCAERMRRAAADTEV